MKIISIKSLLAVGIAGFLGACASPESRNQITVTTYDGQRVELEDTSLPSSANDAVVMVKVSSHH